MNDSDRPEMIVLLGPTASGKTAVSLELARMLDGEIISADSRQVYRWMDIGTAKPTCAERGDVPHHFIDILLPDEPYSAGKFGEDASIVAREIEARGRVPLVVGGSGLYIAALLKGFSGGPAGDPEYRFAMETRVREGGLPDLVEQLRRVDPEAAAGIDCSNPRRVIRALEVFHLSGIPRSEHHRRTREEERFNALKIGLRWERLALYDRIERRCDAMMENGLMREVEELAKRGYGVQLNSLNTVGYAEAFALQEGKITRGEMERLFKQNSRRYAKRQMTWFRALEDVFWIEMEGTAQPVEVAARIARIFSESLEKAAPN